MKILPDLKYLSLVETSDADYLHVTTKEEAVAYIASLRKAIINKVGDAIAANDIKKKDVERNLIFIESFDLEQIVNAYNFVNARRDKKISTANKFRSFAKFITPVLLNVKEVDEKLTDEQESFILNVFGFL
jgi:hypothetical protein